jgi:hypothetical protein
MKPTDFIKEDHNIVQAVVEMHDDHEIQMAREQCYNAASNAIELHRMLKHITERQGLEGWVQEKITLSNDYLRQVKEWMEYEIMNKVNSMNNPSSAMPLETVGETATSGASSSGAVATSTATQYAARPDKSKVPAAMRKRYGGKDWMLKQKDVADPYKHMSSSQTIRRNTGE